MMKKITIIGGGIAGLSTAIALQKLGLKAEVYESAPHIKPLGAGLVLAANALKALDYIGIKEAIIRAGNLVEHFEIKNQKGKILTDFEVQKLSKIYGNTNFTIHRADLHKVLVAHLQPNTLHLGKRIERFEQTDISVKLYFNDGTVHDTDFVIAAEGVHSVFRNALLPKVKERYAGYTCWRAIIQGQPTNFDPRHCSETWGKNGRIGLVPLSEGRIYTFICANSSFQNQAMKNTKAIDLQMRFEGYHSPIPEVLAGLKDEAIIWNDIIDVAPLSKFHFGNILLIGDAAHATTPNMGQGACMAIEDAAVLAAKLQQHQLDCYPAFASFEQARLARTKNIVTQSWQLGKIAQLENPLLIKLRDTFLPLVPASANQKQLDWLYNINFE